MSVSSVLSDARHVLTTVLTRDSLQFNALSQNPDTSNNDVCLSFMLHSCRSYLDATSKLLFALDANNIKGIEKDDKIEPLSAWEAQHMLAQLLGDFAGNLA
jgi:hypothetical protein